MTRRFSQLGFTITEILIATLIGSFILLAVLSTLLSFIKTRTQTTKVYLLENIATSILSQLTQEIHVADDALIQQNQLTLHQGDDQIQYFIYQHTLYRQDTQSGQQTALTPPTVKAQFQVLDRSPQTPPTDPIATSFQARPALDITPLPDSDGLIHTIQPPYTGCIIFESWPPFHYDQVCAGDTPINHSLHKSYHSSFNLSQPNLIAGIDLSQPFNQSQDVSGQTWDFQWAGDKPLPDTHPPDPKLLLTCLTSQQTFHINSSSNGTGFLVFTFPSQCGPAHLILNGSGFLTATPATSTTTPSLSPSPPLLEINLHLENQSPQLPHTQFHTQTTISLRNHQSK